MFVNVNHESEPHNVMTEQQYMISISVYNKLITSYTDLFMAYKELTVVYNDFKTYRKYIKTLDIMM